MTDLTKIPTPFGLMDAETQEALRAHGGPYEYYSDEGWEDAHPMWLTTTTYRVKPQPPKPREWWVNGSHAITNSLNKSHEDLKKDGWTHVREVL